MWKAYAKDKGFVVGLYKGLFDMDFNKKHFVEKYSEIKVLSGRVIYDEREQIELIKKYLLKFYDAYIETSEILPEIESFIGGTFMQTLCYFFKARKYCNEEEYRIIIYRPKGMESEYLPNIVNSPQGKYLKIKIDKEQCHGAAYELFFNTDYTKNEAERVRDNLNMLYNIKLLRIKNEKHFQYVVF